MHGSEHLKGLTMLAQNGGAAAGDEWVCGEYHGNHHENKSRVEKLGQQLKVQVHRDDQSLHPGHLHRASLATAMQ